ncbi:MAG: histidine phosphatase family protein [Pseudomonadota bacterium]
MTDSDRLVIVIRHGETDWNRIGRLQGQRDVPLNDTGRRQARRNGLALSDYLQHLDRVPDEFAWHVSPLARTRETMDLVRQGVPSVSVPYQLDDRLKEFAFGDWEGEILQNIKRNAPDAYRARRQDKWNFQPPNGESYEMLKDRVQPWLDQTSGDMVVVTHGGVVRVLRHLLENRPKHVTTEDEVIQERLYVIQRGTTALI